MEETDFGTDISSETLENLQRSLLNHRIYIYLTFWPKVNEKIKMYAKTFAIPC